MARYAHFSQVPAGAWRWPDFSPAEIACRGTGALLIDERSMDMLQALRTRLGKPLLVLSAYRSPEHNARVGGVKTSQHMLAKAFDISMANHDPALFEVHARGVGFKGIGHYPRSGFMHIDSRASPARWNDGAWFPERETRFAPEKKSPTIIETLAKPEVMGPGGLLTLGAGAVAQSNDPVRLIIAFGMLIGFGLLAWWLVTRAQREKPRD